MEPFRPRLVATFALLLLAPLAAPACDEGTDDPGLVFSGFSVDELEPTRALIRFQTSRPTTCAVEYGLAPGALDRYATDPSMSPEDPYAIDHEVALEDLTPGVTWTYRGAATDPEGRDYRSETRSFTTPGRAGSVLANVALASAGTRVAGVSSNWGGGGDDSSFGANQAIDGKMATEWSSAGDGDGAWIELDLGQERTIAYVAFRSRQMTDGSSIVTSFTLSFGDGEATAGPFSTPDPSQRYELALPQPVTARTVRLDVETSTGGNTGAREIELLVAP